LPWCRRVCWRAGGLALQAGRVLPPASSWLRMLLAAPAWVRALLDDLPGGVRWRGVAAGLAGTSVA
jgi:hypothetical protein